MRRRIHDRRLGRIWVERIVWNVVAAASLAFMIGILLCSLRWLDEIDSVSVGEVQRATNDTRIEFGPAIEDPLRQVAQVNGPAPRSSVTNDPSR